jgi:hypothetical protein
MANLQKTLVESPYDISLASRTNEYVLVDFVYEPEEMVITYPIIDYVLPPNLQLDNMDNIFPQPISDDTTPPETAQEPTTGDSETPSDEQVTTEPPQTDPPIELAKVSITLPGQRLAHLFRTKVELQSGQVLIEGLVAKYEEIARLYGFTIPETIVIDPKLFEVESTQQQPSETEDYWSQLYDNANYEEPVIGDNSDQQQSSESEDYWSQVYDDASYEEPAASDSSEQEG